MIRSAWGAAVVLLLPAWAGAQSQASLPADCFAAAARFHHVSEPVLRAIARVESGFQPLAVNINTNGTADIGMMQINTVHLRELSQWGISETHLRDACVNVFVAAWHYRKQVDRHGHTWRAVGAYHSATPVLRDAYAARVRAAVVALLAAPTQKNPPTGEYAGRQ